VKELDDKLRAAEAEVKSLRAKLADSESHAEELERRHGEAGTKSGEVASLAEKQTHEIKGLQLRAEKAESLADEQEQKAKEYSAALIEREKELLKARADLENLRGDANTHESHTEHLSHKVHELGERADKAELALKAFQERANTAETKLEEHEHKVHELERKLKEVEDQLFSTKNKLAEVEARAERAEQELQR
jgi:chromosome segregation ATPase